MKKTILFIILCFSVIILFAQTQEIYPGADEKTPSKTQYFTWINNTNEGPTEKQTLINLSFFEWLHTEYGMVLDIYAFDAGLIDGRNFYGSMKSNRFKRNFPNGISPVYHKAKSIGTRLGSWGGPDGFGNTTIATQDRKEEMISLCRDYEWALFKFDAVCGQLRSEKTDDFIEMMQGCRKYSPDLILLNHRLELGKGMPYSTTFLWEGQETYIDVFTSNNVTAPHNRAGALSRGITPDLKRLAEDCGVCISSCLDYWDDDLILQAFNRSMILAPEVYGNPWFLRDDEYPKFARIYNLHRKYGKILVDGLILPESYGPYPVSRGNESTRLITVRNLEWTEKKYSIKLDKEIGLEKKGTVNVRMFHPFERIIGNYQYGGNVEIVVPPFRSALIYVSTNSETHEPGIIGIDFEITKNKPQQPVEIKLFGLPGTTHEIRLANIKPKKVLIEGKEVPALSQNKSYKIDFEGDQLKYPYHRKLADLIRTDIKDEASALYEATVYAADNNALEIRSLERSGKTNIPQVQAARDAFFDQPAFINRGLFDKYLFDGKMETGFWPSRKYGFDQRVKEGCFRLDLGEIRPIDSIVFKIKDEYALEPFLIEEGVFAYISSDLKTWEQITFITGLNMNAEVNKSFRYLKMSPFPQAIAEVEAFSNGKIVNNDLFRASNLFADSRKMRCEAMWNASFILDEIADNSYLSVAINGEHGIEGAYAALKIDNELIGSPSRAVSYPSNTWEYINSKSSSNYTYYFPLTNEMKNKTIEVFVMGYNKEHLSFKPEVWISAYPIPFKYKVMTIYQ